MVGAEKSMKKTLARDAVSNPARLMLITYGDSVRDRRGRPLKLPNVLYTIQICNICSYSDKDGLPAYPATPPVTVTGFWHMSNTECHDAKSIQTAVLNKSACRYDQSTKQKLTTNVEVPLGRKADSLKHVDPTSLEF